MKNFFLKRIKILTAFVLLLSCTGYLSTLHFTFELTSHFKPQYLALSLLFSFVFILARQWRWASLGLLGFFINGMVVLTWYIPNTEISAKNHHPVNLKLLLSNINAGNDNYSALIKLITTEQADIFIVQEINADWIKQLNVLEKTFPYRIATSEMGIFGTVIFSRFPFEQSQIISLGNAGIESILIKVRINGKVVSLLTTHPLPPINQQTFEYRNNQLFEVFSVMGQLLTPKILIGDLNLSMSSPIYSNLTKGSGLINARQDFGILPTWPTFLPFMMIPIDHCLVSPDIQVIGIKTGSPVGSDHLPLIVEIAILSSHPN